MGEPQTFSGLSAADADTMQQVCENDGAIVQRSTAADGTITLVVSYPGRPAPQAPRPPSGSGNAAAVIAACEAEWPMYKGDCSGFVRHVAGHFDIALTGLANDIVAQICETKWRRLANGRAAKAAADAGEFVVGGLKGSEQAEPEPHGHVVVVVSGPLTRNAYPSAYWGRLGGVGKKDATVNWAWNARDRDRVIYAARAIGER